MEAQAAETRADWSRAAAIWVRCLALKEATYGRGHPEVAGTLGLIGETLHQRRRFAEAEPLFARALAINERALGPNHPDTVSILGGLALNRKAQKRFAEAELLYERALAIRERTLGSDHPDTAISLNNLALNRKAQGRFAEAEPLYERALAIRERVFGPDHLETATSLNNLALNHDAQSRHTAAEPLLAHALAIREKVLGPNNPDTASSLGSLAHNRYAQGRYAEAEPLYERVLAFNEGALGPDHPTTALSLDNLAVSRSDQGRYAEAEPLYERALAIRERTLGSDHPDIATSLNNLALNRKAQGRYAEAEPLYERALAIRERVFGPDHPDIASSLNNLARNRDAQGRFTEAKPLYERALAIRERALGPDHLDTALSLNNLALNRNAQSRYAEAEPLLARALAISEKALGSGHPNTAKTLNNLAYNRNDQGRHAEAEPLYERALALNERTLGADHPNTALSLNNLASNRNDQGRHAEAEPLYERALAIRERVFGPDHPDTASSLNNLAYSRDRQGRHAEAEPLLARSLAISEKALGSDHPTTAKSLNNLAYNRSIQGRHAEAEPLYERALAIFERALGPDHSDTASSLDNIARNRRAQGRYVEALSASRSAAAIWARRIARGGEADSEQRAGAGAFLTLADLLSDPNRYPNQPEPARLDEAFRALQYAQGTDVARAVAGTLARTAAGSDDLSRLVRARQDLALKLRALSVALDKAVAQSPEQRDAGADAALRAEIAHTGADLDAASAILARDFPRFVELASPRPVALTDLQAELRPDETLVSWTVTSRATYLFAVRREAANLRRLDLGAYALRTRVMALRDGLDPRGRLPIDMPPFDIAAAHALYRDLLGPVDDLIGYTRHLILVPDGPLESLPPAVLVTAAPSEAGDEFARYRAAAWLVRRQALSIAPTVSSFVALRRSPKPRPTGPTRLADLGGAFAGYGDPDFQAGSPTGIQAPDSVAVRERAEGQLTLTSLFRGGVASPEGLRALPRLPESADELRAIAQALDAPADSVHLGHDASVSAITRADLSRIRVLAFATHGLIAGELPRLAEPALAFTPPSEPNEADDGLLRASQVAKLRLGAQFVVLSACNTAAPDGTPGASGLSGLAKAFIYAGARSLLVSHWPVDSAAAARLTKATFAALREEPGIGRAEALRRASVTLITGGRPSNLDAHPLIWAPFTLIGEDGDEPDGAATNQTPTLPLQKK